MTKRILTAGATAFAILLVAGVVFAQVTTSNGVTLTSSPVTTTVSPGSQVTLGTFTVTGDAQGAMLTSIPLNLTTGGSATASELSNCQVFNANGTALATAFAPTAGNNTVTFSSPLSVGGGSGTTNTYTIRCDVATGTPSGSTFMFNAGAPTFGNALNVNLVAPASVQQGANSQVLGLITLDATRSGGNVSVSSIPVTITGNGASVSELSNCNLRDINNITGSVGTGTTASSGTGENFTLATPVTVNGGTRMTLALTCDVAASTPVGGSFAVSIAPSGINAVAQNGGVALTPTTSIGSTGSALPTSGSVLVSSTATPASPGLPNTGEGGFAPLNAMILILSALVLAGAALFARRAYR